MISLAGIPTKTSDTLEELRKEMRMVRWFLVVLCAVVVVAPFSYVLARRLLMPIEQKTPSK